MQSGKLCVRILFLRSHGSSKSWDSFDACASIEEMSDQVRSTCVLTYKCASSVANSQWYIALLAPPMLSLVRG